MQAVTRRNAGLTLTVASLTAAAVLATTPKANAQLITLANITQGTASESSLRYTNTFGTTGTPGSNDITGQFSVLGVNATHPYDFTFQAGNLYGPDGTPVKATLVSFSGNTIGPVQYIPMVGAYTVRLANWKGTFRAVSAVNGKTNLLTFDYSSAGSNPLDTYMASMQFSAMDAGTATFNINFRTTGSPTDFANIFTSDFIDLNNPNALGLFYTRQSMTGSIAVNLPITVNANGTLRSFAGDPSFQFNTDPGTPPPPPPPPGPDTTPTDGCSAGFWKTHTGLEPGQENAWAGAGFNPATSTLAEAGFITNKIPGTTKMLEALSLPGNASLKGVEATLLREAVAALLNAKRLSNYPMTAGDVVSQVNAAIASRNRAQMISLSWTLDYNSDESCPLC